MLEVRVCMTIAKYFSGLCSMNDICAGESVIEPTGDEIEYQPRYAAIVMAPTPNIQKSFLRVSPNRSFGIQNKMKQSGA